jgi:hypothetical protein
MRLDQPVRREIERRAQSTTFCLVSSPFVPLDCITPRQLLACPGAFYPSLLFG